MVTIEQLDAIHAALRSFDNSLDWNEKQIKGTSDPLYDAVKFARIDLDKAWKAYKQIAKNR